MLVLLLPMLSLSFAYFCHITPCSSLVHSSQKKKKNKNRTKCSGSKKALENPLQGLPEWMVEFTEHLVDRKSLFSASDGSEPPEPPHPDPLPDRRTSGKHHISTQFANDPNCEICQQRLQEADCRRCLSSDLTTKTSQETMRSLRKFLIRKPVRKSFTQTIRWILVKLVKTSDGINVRQHSGDSVQRYCRKSSAWSLRRNFSFPSTVWTR